MGRRKIEIQPITHERNRSVTFLKRKNGLFKKAYELGVLCSVDVAVIIFEDRPGHDLKLHQYSSSDIRDIVQKQVRHQGEKDIKIPGDFSGAGGVKFDEIGDGDDDVVEEEEEAPVRNNKRGGKLSLPADVATTSAEYNPPLGIESGSLLPVSNDRVSSLRDSHTRSNKRPRPPSRSPSPPPPGLYLPDQAPARYNRQIRHLPPQYHHDDHPSHNFHPQYTPLFPTPARTSPPPTFIPVHANYIPSRGPSSFPRDMGAPGGSMYTHHPGSRPTDLPYDPALYSMMRHQAPPPLPPPPHSRREDRGDMFGTFLEADERLREQARVGPGSSGLDWPVHEEPIQRGTAGLRGQMEGSSSMAAERKRDMVRFPLIKRRSIQGRTQGCVLGAGSRRGSNGNEVAELFAATTRDKGEGQPGGGSRAPREGVLELRSGGSAERGKAPVVDSEDITMQPPPPPPPPRGAGTKKPEGVEDGFGDGDRAEEGTSDAGS